MNISEAASAGVIKSILCTFSAPVEATGIGKALQAQGLTHGADDLLPVQQIASTMQG